MIERIEQYINGVLTCEEVLDLWVALIKEPEYIDYLEINLLLRELFRENSENTMGLTPRACL